MTPAQWTALGVGFCLVGEAVFVLVNPQRVRRLLDLMLKAGGPTWPGGVFMVLAALGVGLVQRTAGRVLGIALAVAAAYLLAMGLLVFVPDLFRWLANRLYTDPKFRLLRILYTLEGLAGLTLIGLGLFYP